MQTYDVVNVKQGAPLGYSALVDRWRVRATSAGSIRTTLASYKARGCRIRKGVLPGACIGSLARLT